MAALIVSLMACGPRFPRPFTATQFASVGTGPALVHYLSQPDASASVCELMNNGPHLTRFDGSTLQALVTGLVRGQIAPPLWQRCATSLLEGMDPQGASILLDAMEQAYLKLVRVGNLDRDVQRQQQLAVLHEVLVNRPSGMQAHQRTQERLGRELGKALAGGRLGPTGRSYASDFVATMELERETWQGRPVDEATLDALQAERNERVLRRCATRLSNPALRDQAKRRIIRLHIDASPFPEVKESAQAVEDLVLQNGRYPISTRDFPPVRGWIDTSNSARVPLRGVLVRQHVLGREMTLFGLGGSANAKPSVLPEIALRGALQIELTGLPHPVTLCGPPKDLDPTPCVPAEELIIDNPLAYLDRDGNFHFAEHIRAADVLPLLEGGSNFLLPVNLAGKPLFTIPWTLSFERPKDIVLTGTGPGAPGPNLGIGVDHRNPSRLVYTINVGSEPYYAVVELADASHFHVVSQGNPGVEGGPGPPGYNGRPGRPGRRALCPSVPGEHGGPGENGGPGGPGGPGSPGGPGGDISVSVHCGAQRCDDVLPLLSRSILSHGGPGGPGGAGGPGGVGGSGGPGGHAVSCGGGGRSYTLPSGHNGHPGLAGPPGPQGLQGLNGPSGRITVQVR